MMSAMKSLRLLAALLAIATCAQAQTGGRLDTKMATTPSRIVPVDRIVAVVNDEVITQNDLSERVNLVVRQFQRQGGQLPPADTLSRQILERMITDLLQVQLAKEGGIKIDDITLDRTIERIAQENNLSIPDFRAALERDGIKYPRFREDIRNEILLARLREREVENTIVVTDAEVETELARQARDKTGDSEYRLAHILVTVPAQATPEQIEQRRRRALVALASSELSFASSAKSAPPTMRSRRRCRRSRASPSDRPSRARSRMWRTCVCCTPVAAALPRFSSSFSTWKPLGLRRMSLTSPGCRRSRVSRKSAGRRPEARQPRLPPCIASGASE